MFENFKATTPRTKTGDVSVYLGEPVNTQTKSISFADRVPRPCLFTILSSLILLFYITYGYLLEWIFRQEGMKPHGWYLTLVQFANYSAFGKVHMMINRDTKRRIPWTSCFALAAATLTTMGFSNASLGYLNFPTQSIFKCCKLIPVLIGGIVIQGKKFSCYDLWAASVMSFGLIVFTLADSKVSPNFEMTGVVMISIGLMGDAVVGNVQEKTMKQHKASNAEVVFFSYSLGFLILLCGLAFTGNLGPSISYFAEASTLRYSTAFVFSACGYLGIQIILTFVREFGAFLCVTVTSFRKALSITLSFVLFSKPFSINYVYGGLLVLLGIYLNLFGKMQKEDQQKKELKV